MISTDNFPQLALLVNSSLDGLHRHRCFNNRNLSFQKELQQTELGHFFEHLILEYLRQFNSNKNYRRSFRGVTSWDWRKERKGIFHITLNIGEEDREALDFAFQGAGSFLEKVFHNPLLSTI